MFKKHVKIFLNRVGVSWKGRSVFNTERMCPRSKNISSQCQLDVTRPEFLESWDTRHGCNGYWSRFHMEGYRSTVTPLKSLNPSFSCSGGVVHVLWTTHCIMEWWKALITINYRSKSGQLLLRGVHKNVVQKKTPKIFSSGGCILER